MTKGMKYFLYRLRTLKAPLIAVSIFSFVSYPVLCGIAALFIKQEAHSNSSWGLGSLLSLSLVVSVQALVMLFLTGYVILRKNFRYLFRRDFVDLDMSLPVSGRTKFLGDFFSGLAVYIVPHFLSALIGNLLISDAVRYANRMSSAGKTVNSFDIDYSMFQSAVFTGLFMCLLFYCTCLFTMSFCGRRFEGTTVPFLLNFAVPGIVFFSCLLSCGRAYGIESGNMVYEVPDGALSTTPLGLFALFFIRLANRYIVGYRSLSAKEAFSFLGNFLWLKILLFCAALTVLTYFIIKLRRSERTGKPYVFPVIGDIASIVEILSMTMCIACFLLEGGTVRFDEGIASPEAVPLGIFWLIATLILFIFSQRKGKGKKTPILASAGKYIAFCAASVFVTFLVTMSDGLGASYRIPAVGDIKDVYVQIGQGYNEYNGILTEADKITAVHREIITAKPDASADKYNSIFRIDYVLNNGERFQRQYCLDAEYTEKVWDAAVSSGFFERRYDLYIDSLTPESVYIPELRYNAMSYGRSYEPGYTYESSGDAAYFYLNSESGATLGQKADIPMDKLAEALKADSRLMTFKNRFETAYLPPKQLAVVLTRDTGKKVIRYIDVYPFFANTLSLLRENGCELDFSVPVNGRVMLLKTVENDSGFYIFSSRDLRYYKGKYCRDITGAGEQEIAELIKHTASDTCCKNSDCYCLALLVPTLKDGYIEAQTVCQLPVTEDYAAQAERLWLSGENVSDEDARSFLAEH